MRSLLRVASTALVALAMVTPARESPAGPVSTAPRPPPTSSPSLMLREVKPVCTPIVPLAHYTFDDVLTDKIGRFPPFASPTGVPAPTFVAGRIGKAVAFTNGVELRATLPALPSAFTTSVWFRQASATVPSMQSTSGTCTRTYGSDVVVYSHSRAIDVMASFTGGNCGTVAGSAIRIGGVTAAARIGAWTNVVTVFDGTVGRVYQDGKEVGTTASTYAFKTSTASGWFMGNNVLGTLPGTDKNSFIGEIDDLRIYGIAASLPQVAMLQAGGDVTAVCDRTL